MLPPVVAQLYEWDCGVACALCLLRHFHHLRGNQSFQPSLYQSFPGPSVWTIELAYFLHREGINVMFSSAYIGVDPSHENVGFYASCFREDAKRIELCFQQADASGMTVVERSVGEFEMAAWLAASPNRYLIILVDATVLESATDGIYRGHYIVVTGRPQSLPHTPSFMMMDPRHAADGWKCIGGEKLSVARQAPGTDEDIIWISLSKAEVTAVPATSLPIPPP